MAYCFPPSTYKHPEFELLYEMAVRGVEVFNRNDLLANEGVQISPVPEGEVKEARRRLASLRRAGRRMAGSRATVITTMPAVVPSA